MKGVAPAFRISTEGLTSATTALISAGWVTSPRRTAAPSRSTSASRPGSRATTVTCAPRASSALTIPSPSPRLPPVTTTRSSGSVRDSSPLMDIADLASDRLERSKSGHAFHVRPHVGMLAHGLDVLDALPLGVVDHAPTILADMDAGGDVTLVLAHEGFRALFEDGDQLLLVLGIHGKDVDQRHDPAVGANGHFHRWSPVVSLGRAPLHGQGHAARKAARDEGPAGSVDRGFACGHCRTPLSS